MPWGLGKIMFFARIGRGKGLDHLSLPIAQNDGRIDESGACPTLVNSPAPKQWNDPIYHATDIVKTYAAHSKSILDAKWHFH